MVMASEHTLPRLFSLRERSRDVPWVSLLALTAMSLAFALAAPLEIISSFASATFLLIFFAINLSALRACRRIGLAPIWPIGGALLTAASFALLVAQSYAIAPRSLLWIGGFYAAAVAVEAALTLQRGTRKETAS
jgi:hypothetical protein